MNTRQQTVDFYTLYVYRKLEAKKKSTQYTWRENNILKYPSYNAFYIYQRKTIFYHDLNFLITFSKTQIRIKIRNSLVNYSSCKVTTFFPSWNFLWNSLFARRQRYINWLIHTSEEKHRWRFTSQLPASPNSQSSGLSGSYLTNSSLTTLFAPQFNFSRTWYGDRLSDLGM